MAKEVKETPVVEEAVVEETPVEEVAVEKVPAVKIKLTDQFTTNGVPFGPGEVEVTEAIAEDLRARQDAYTNYKLSLHQSSSVNKDMGEIG